MNAERFSSDRLFRSTPAHAGGLPTAVAVRFGEQAFQFRRNPPVAPQPGPRS